MLKLLKLDVGNGPLGCHFGVLGEQLSEVGVTDLVDQQLPGTLEPVSFDKQVEGSLQ